MERMTIRKNGKAMVDFMKVDSNVQILVNRLAELEDKLESGQLVELPCKVDDTVYKPDIDRGRILIGKVKKIHYEIADGEETFYMIADCGNRDKELPWDKQVFGFFFNPNTDWNKTIFGTIEQAETRLKELQEKRQ